MIPRTRPLKVPPMRVNDIYNESFTEYGIFSLLNRYHPDLPFLAKDVHRLDSGYLIHSGQKFFSSYIAYLYDNARYREVIEYLYSLYGAKWMRAYPLIGEGVAPYDPLIDTLIEKVTDENGNISYFKSLTRNSHSDEHLSNDKVSNSSDITEHEFNENNELVNHENTNTNASSDYMDVDKNDNEEHSYSDSTKASNKNGQSDTFSSSYDKEALTDRTDNGVYGFNSDKAVGDTTSLEAKQSDKKSDSGDFTNSSENISELTGDDKTNQKFSDSSKMSNQLDTKSESQESIKSENNTNSYFNDNKTTNDSNENEDRISNDFHSSDEKNDETSFKDVNNNEKGIKSHTYQELAKQELELMLQSYYCMVYDDIDRALCCPHYAVQF